MNNVYAKVLSVNFFETWRTGKETRKWDKNFLSNLGAFSKAENMGEGKYLYSCESC